MLRTTGPARLVVDIAEGVEDEAALISQIGLFACS